MKKRVFVSIIALVIMLTAIATTIAVTTFNVVVSSPTIAGQSFTITATASNPDHNIVRMSLGRDGNFVVFDCVPAAHICTKTWVMNEATPGQYTYTVKAKNDMNQVDSQAIVVNVLSQPTTITFKFRTAAIDGASLDNNDQMVYIDPSTIKVNGVSSTGAPYATFNVSADKRLDVIYTATDYIQDGDIFFFDSRLPQCTSTGCDFTNGDSRTTCNYVAAESKFECTLDNPNYGGPIVFYYHPNDADLGPNVIRVLNRMYKTGCPIVNINISNATFVNGQSYTGLDLDNYVYDSNTPKSDLMWTVSRMDNVLVTIGASNVITIIAANSAFSGNDIVRFTASDGTCSDSDDLLVIVQPSNGQPTITIDAPQPGDNFTENCGNIDFNSTATDPDGTIVSYEWIYDGGVIGTTEDISVPASTFNPGINVVLVRATDNKGGTASDSVAFNIVAHSNPTCMITSPINPNPLAYLPIPEGQMLDFAATAAPTDNCAVAMFQYIWRDNGIPIVTNQQSFSMDNLTAGPHNMTLYVTDGLGGVCYDTLLLNITQTPNIPPTAAITSPLSGQNFVEDCEQINFSVNANDADGTIANILWYWESGLISTLQSFVMNAASFGIGNHNVSVTVIDNLGAVGNDAVQFNVVDHINPTVVITSPENDPDPVVYFDYTEGSLINFSATATATDVCVPAQFQYMWRDNNVPIVTDRQSFGLSNLSVGTHNITVYATDGYGGEAYDTILINITPIPNTPPVANILTPSPLNNQFFVQECEIIGFTSQIYDPDPTGSISSIIWMWNGNILSTNENFTINASAFPLGNNTVSLTVTDNLGTPATDSVVFEIRAHTPPAVSILSPPNGTSYPEGTGVNFNVQAIATDVCPVVFSWMWRDDIIPTQIISRDQAFTLYNLSVGVHDITAYAYDQYGQSNYSRTIINITDVPNIAPIITGMRCVNSTGGPRLKEWDPIYCNATADDSDGIITTWLWSVNGSGVSIGPVVADDTYEILAGLNDGNYTVRLMVLDNGTPVLSATDFINIEVLANMPPVVTITLPGTDPYWNMEFCSIDFSATASDPDGYILQPWDEIYTWNIAMANGTTVPSVSLEPAFTYLKRLPVGFNAFTVTVTDDDGATASDSVTINTTANIPPTVQIMQPVTWPTYNVSEGNNLTFSADVTNGNQDDCASCTLNDYTWVWFDNFNDGVNPPATTQISSQRAFTFVRPAVGIHTITVTGTDCYGASNIDQIIVNVTEIPNQNPVVTIWRPVDAAVDYYIDHCENVPFNATAVDPDGDNINAWMWNFDTTTGMQTRTVPVFSISAMNFTIGNHTAYAYAFDNQTPPGVGSASVTYQIRQHTNPIAVINAPSNGTNIFFGTPIDFTGSGTTTDRCNADQFSWIWTEDGNIMSTQQSFSTFSLSLGWHKITLFVTDQYGHSNSTSVYINITPVPNANPVVTITTPVDAAVDYYIDHCENVPFNATAVDPDGDDITTWMWNYQTLAGLQTRTVQSFYVPAIEFSIGNHTADVYAFDNRTPPGVGNDSVVFRIAQHTDPVVSIAQPLNGSMWMLGSPVDFTASAVATDRCNADQFSWIWTDEIGNSLSSQQSFTTSSLSRGWHRINVFATDQYGHSNSTFVYINITEDVNDAPVITSLNCYDMTGNATIMEFENFFCNATATDVDGVITSWVWNVDGFATQSTPGIFVSPAGLANGTYDATLTVVDNGTTTPPLSTTLTVPLVIWNNGPTVTLIPPTQSGNEPYTANFTCSVAGGNMPYSYVFNFGNGITDVIPAGNDTSVYFTVTYAQNGTYTVMCNVTDMDGDSDSSTAIVIVGDAIPTAFFNWTPLTPYENETVQFMDQSTWTNDPIVSWFWTFGDGSNSTVQNPTHRYTQEPLPLGTSGPYTVTLTVTDSDGSVNSTSLPITVLDTVPQIIVLTGPAQIQEGTFAAFTGVATGYDVPLNYTWSFGDGNTTSGIDLFNPSNYYGNNGIYTVTLTVTDADGSPATGTITINVTDTAPTANAGSDQTVYECNVVYFNGNLSTAYDQPLTYMWDFNGDGIFDVSNVGVPTATYTYMSNATYIVNLTVQDSDGTRASDLLTVTVMDTGPDAFFTYAPLNPNEGTLVNFNSAGSVLNMCDAGHTYIWDFGDNNTATGATASNTYIDNGIYTVNLTVTDSDMSADSYTLSILVGDVDPIASFTAMPNPADEGSTVTFNPAASAPGSATDSITSYIWDFNDGSAPVTTTLPLIQNHVFADNGTYNITLTVYDEDSFDVASILEIVLNVPPQNVEAYGMYYCQANQSTTIVATASDPAGINDPLIYEWDLNYTGGVFDVNISSAPTTSGMFITSIPCPPDEGLYTLALRVSDDDGGVGNDTAILNVTTVAVNSPPYFTPALVSQPWPVGVLFVYDINATDPDGDLFTFSSSDVAITADGLISTTFAVAGNYTINVTVCDDSGFPNACNSGVFTLYVTAANVPPTASFTYAPVPGVEGQNIDFTSTSTDLDGIIVSWSWIFGDGTTGSGSAINHAYNDNGTYNVNLTVVDDDGAISSTVAQVTVTNANPVINSVTNNGPVNEGSNALIIVAATDVPGDTLTYDYDCNGDGTFEVTGQASNSYNCNFPDGTTIVTVNVRVNDEDGGSATSSTPVTVNNLNPTAEAGGPYSCSVGGTANLLGSGTDPAGVNDPLSYVWDLDNNLVYETPGQNVVFNCVAVGTYTVNLQVSDGDGGVGTDSAIVTVSAVADTTPPVITLLTPADGATWVTSNNVLFEYSADDATSGISLCELIINGASVTTDNTITEGITQNFTWPLANGAYTWSVNCTDSSANMNEGASATRSLTVNVAAPPFCGNGVLDAGEQCDDNNNINGDGCSAVCVIEFCSDGILQTLREQCDDGNLVNGDGCSALCTIEGFPPATCGNGVINPGEQCDGVAWGPVTGCANFDSFTAGTLSCSASCTFNTSLCTGPGIINGTCGDGVINPGEECDGAAWGPVTGCANFDSFTAGTLSCNNCRFNTSLCTIGVGNNPPVANAGPDQSVLVNTLVTLNGAGSTDDGLIAPLTYSWTQIAGTGVVLAGSNTIAPSFTPTASGIYTFNLTVFDGQYYSSDSVTVNVYTVQQSLQTAFALYNATGDPVSSIPSGQTVYAVLSINNMRNFNINGITSTLTATGFTITGAIDAPPADSTITSNIPALGAATIWWQLQAGAPALRTISVDTAGIVDSRNIQVN